MEDQSLQKERDSLEPGIHAAQNQDDPNNGFHCSSESILIALVLQARAASQCPSNMRLPQVDVRDQGVAPVIASKS